MMPSVPAECVMNIYFVVGAERNYALSHLGLLYDDLVKGSASASVITFMIHYEM